MWATAGRCGTGCAAAVGSLLRILDTTTLGPVPGNDVLGAGAAAAAAGAAGAAVGVTPLLASGAEMKR